MTTSVEGRSLGRYQLLLTLGQGGMGEVHLAKLTGAAGFEKLCIVKTILPHLVSDGQFVDRFHHEAKVLVQLTHSNIAQVYDMGDVGGTLYMAIEYVAGVDLSRVETRLDRQGALMPIPIALYVGQKMAEALGYAHRKTGPDGAPLGIVHRDVSPQNVMVSYEGEVKVIDFGLAKSAARSKHTLPATVMGKLGYMSPEQASAHPVDHRSDIFSAGIVVWELLAGRPLYRGGTLPEMVAQMAVAAVPLLRDVRPEVSPALEQVVMRALAKDPAARYQRADDFARALNELGVREQQAIGAEEVGNYVRAMCPEEFAAERQLQSKLSIMRRSRPAPAVDERATDEVPLEGTFLRSSPPEGVPSRTTSGSVMTPAQRAMSVLAPAPGRAAAGPAPTSEVALSVPKSRAPALVVGALAALALAGGGAWLVLGRGEAPAASPDPVAMVAVDAGLPPPVVAAPAAPAPVDAGRALPEAEEHLIPRGAVWTVVSRGDSHFVTLEPGDTLRAGDRLDLLGAPGADGQTRPVYGHAAVVAVTGALAEVLVGDRAALPEELFAARDASPRAVAHAGAPRSPKAAPAPEPTKTAPAPEPTKTAPAPEPTKTAPAPEPTKAAPAPEPTKTAPAPEPTKTAPAPEPTKGAPVPVPDPVRGSAPPAQAEVAPAPSPEPSKRPELRQLFGSISVSAPGLMGGRVVLLRSDNDLTLNNCEVRLPSNVVYRFGKKAVSARQQVRVPFKEFKSDSRPADPQFKQDWAAVYCREGTGYWKTTFPTR